MKTMRFTSTATLLISSVAMGLVVSALTALTGTGAAGIYGFGFIGLLLLVTFLHWPEIRSRFPGMPSLRSARTDIDHRARRRHGPS